MSSYKIKIDRIADSKLNHLPTLENIPFGKYFSDHMLQASYSNGKWDIPEILPYQPISFFPALSALHYGQSIFEGMKAFKNQKKDSVGIFRMKDHYKRMLKSAQRIAMPEIPEDIFIEGMKNLISLDRKWAPPFEGHSLYIRPFLFATDISIGVRPSSSYLFMIICSPAAAYYSKPISVLAEDEYSRAALGGTGSAKVAGNYAAALHPTQLATKKGFDQVLWTDDQEHSIIQEVGTMNLFFVLEENKVITPSLDAGTILDGITRKSVIRLLERKNISVLEQDIPISFIMDMHHQGKLKEIFGTGTAVVISPVAKLKYKEETIDLSGRPTPLADSIKKELVDIRYGIREDVDNWMTWI